MKNINKFNDLLKSYENTLQLEVTSFENVHRAIRGRNGVGELVDLSTRVIQADSVYAYQTKGYIRLYVKSPCCWGHGFGTDDQVLIKYKDKKGKVQHAEATKERLVNLLSPQNIATFKLEEYREFWSKHIDKNIDNALEDKEPTYHSSKEFAEKYIDDLIQYDLRRDDTKELSELMKHIGLIFISVFTYSFQVSFTPSYTIEAKNSIEFGWRDSHTYNNLPKTLKLSLVKDIKHVKLADLGVELPGYHSHTDLLRVRPEQAKAARKFARQFENKKNKSLATLLKKVG